MSGIQTIIFIKDTLFTRRDYDRFGVNLLRENGFYVEMWEITPVLHREVLEKLDTRERVEDSGFYLFSSMQDVLSAISSLENTSIVHFLIPFTWNTLPVFRALSKKMIPCSTTSLAAVPLPKIYTDKQGLGPWYDQIRNIRRYPIKRTVMTFTNRLLLRHFHAAGVHPLAICLAGGSRSIDTLQLPSDRSTAIIWGHSFDYDRYLELRGQAAPPDYNIGVFIDQNIPFHPEHFYSNNYQVCSPEHYFPALRNFFDYVEKNLLTCIMIAGHPTSDYPQDSNYFGNRPVHYGETAELIRQSKFVITHGSTALNYAVLFEKPIIFITTSQLRHSIIQQDIDVISELLSKEPITIDGPHTINWQAEMSIDSKAYRLYRQEYIKTEYSEDIPLWQIYSNAVKKFPVRGP